MRNMRKLSKTMKIEETRRLIQHYQESNLASFMEIEGGILPGGTDITLNPNQ